MTIDFNQTLKEYDGTPFVDEKGQDLTLKQLSIMAARTNFQEDANLDLPAKFDIGAIPTLIHKGIELTPDQVIKLKDRIARLTNATLAYAAANALDGV